MPDSGDNVCSICHENEPIQSVGKCDHHVCFKCATRMRVLMGHSYCPICRTELEKIVFVKTKLRFADACRCAPAQLDSTAHGISFEDKFVQAAFEKLLTHCCMLCKDGQSKPFPSFSRLQDHVRKEHQLFYCDVCVEHLKLFSWERKCYNRTELAQHRRKGDPDDTSHKGHPLCEFCEKRFLDSDELWRHLRKDHFFCHFCDADGKHLFFNAYAEVLVHFRQEHFLCEEGQCANVQFTNVFRSDIDMRAHKAQHHTRHLSKGEQRQVRTLDVQINYGPIRHRNAAGANSEYDGPTGDDRRLGSSRGISRTTAEEDDVAVAVRLSQQSADAESNREQRQLQFDAEDFPDLVVAGKAGQPGPAAVAARGLPRQQAATSGAGAPKAPTPMTDSMARRFARMSNFTVVEGNGVDGQPDDFPALVATIRAPQLQKPMPQPKKCTPSPAAAPTRSTSTAAAKVKNNAWSMDQEFPALSGGGAAASFASSSTAAAPAASWTKVPKSKSKHGVPQQQQQQQQQQLAPADDFPSLLAVGSELSSSGPAGKWAITTAAPQRHGSGKPRDRPTGEAPTTATGGKGTASSGRATEEAVADDEQPKAKSKKKKKKAAAAPAAATSKPRAADLADGSQASAEAGAAQSGPSTRGVQPQALTGTSQVAPVALSATADRGGVAEGGMQPVAATTASWTAQQRQYEENASLELLPASNSSDSFPALPRNKALQAQLPPSVAAREAQPAASSRQPPGLAASAGASSGPLPVAALPSSLADIANFISPQAIASPGLAPPPGLTGPVLRGSSMQRSAPADVALAVDSMLKQPPLLLLPGAELLAADAGGAKLKHHATVGGAAVTISGSNGEAVADRALTFVEPPDFQARNASLARKFRTIVEDCQGKLDTFRTLTSRFRNGLIDARSFYETCVDLVGDVAFATIFPELLVLLPDVTKQVELLQAHTAFVSEANDTALAALAVDELFTVCDICEQVLAGKDVAGHQLHHQAATKVAQPTGDDFPPLTGPVGNGHLLRSWVRQK